MNLRLQMLVIGVFILNSAAWRCSKPGRFRNPDEDETSCELYVTCIPNPDGTFEIKNDQCNIGNMFSAKYQRCITGDSCDNLEDFYAIEYECKECGKFVNVKSQDCRQFVNCLKTKDPGVFIPVKQSCPNNQVFSAKTLSCVDENDYQCPPIVLKSLSDFVCLNVGKYPDESVPNCRGYRLCSKLRNGTMVSKNFLCEKDHIFSEIERKCVTSDIYDCPDDGNHDFKCSAVGRYPDKLSKTCETFYNCFQNSEGELKATLLTCSRGNIFSAITSKCVSTSEYVCPIAHVELELLDHHTVSAIKRLTEEEEIAACAESGRFPNENDQCETYYLCSRDPQANWFKVIAHCPPESLFSPEQKRCVSINDYACPITTTQSFSVTDSAFEESSIECIGAGRVSNREDDTCRTYYLCSLNLKNVLTSALFICPENSVFSTKQNKCVPNETYTCASFIETTITPEISDESGDGIDIVNSDQVDQSSASNTSLFSEYPISYVYVKTESTTSTLPTNYKYPCTATGRFADMNSADCRSYFLCTEYKSGTILSVHLHCPSGMVFSRNESKCVVSTKYLC
ncbi:uncharacterized protein LOC129717718 [Wyeomyia smithii]|uniref:uncharacterized protein LOC129717718 n=1 Tax=Wyeomyia smithii TaxID=174621 RepID=UPI002467CB35|nr:uncharacterized protein LOC129717718 [Wyeomyia smithii]